jgi:DNA topoisomerase-3
LGIPELTKPELTGDWEFQLKEMQRKKISREQFMTGIQDMTRRIVDRAKSFEQDTIPGDFGMLKVACPKCGGEVHEKYKHYQCIKCDFRCGKLCAGGCLSRKKWRR